VTARSPTSRRLPATVFALGTVSFFTDLSSEMIYPLLPVFLTTVLAAGPHLLGVIEGIAESTASLLKVVSGFWSDRMQRRKPLVVAGYSLACVARPLIGLAGTWPVVLFLRFTDRVGKGIRTSPRDALIADVTSPEQRGQAYGVQRALDHAGAVAGPLVAMLLMTFIGLSMRNVFLLALIPGAVAVAVVLFAVREPPARPPTAPASAAARRTGAWRSLGRPFYALIGAFVVFTLGNSTDAFLLLRLHQAGVGPGLIAALWSALHVAKMLAAYAGGLATDRLGRRPMMVAGFIVYAAVYVGFAVTDTAAAMIAVFIAYGLYFGLTEPAERAWVSDLVPDRQRATAFGVYHGALGLAALPASIVFGLVWHAYGAPAAFFMGASLSAIAALLLFLVPSKP
jgi:MFS family permease